MNRSRFRLSLGLAASATLLLFSVPVSAQHWTITITNLTSGQTFTPIMVASHKVGVSLYTLGTVASTDLQKMAEGGDLSGLEATLGANPLVKQVTDTAANLSPGASVTITILGGGAFNHLSVASMLIPTNDGFFALNSAFISRVKGLFEGGPGSKSLTFFSPAYDAGSKLDDELCINIPGPMGVCAGTGYVTTPTGPGFVFIHSGIHGIGDLAAKTYDWGNPVAKIEVTPGP